MSCCKHIFMLHMLCWLCGYKGPRAPQQSVWQLSLARKVISNFIERFFRKKESRCLCEGDTILSAVLATASGAMSWSQKRQSQHSIPTRNLLSENINNSCHRRKGEALQRKEAVGREEPGIRRP
ncbi:hypothetical protein KIL84_008204 [Mauremys mutica]|uniref:Secreted protein n=1 Tax=Mauremys mutica TaxID=74926 RepID=A0A9D3X9U3_9SAUR|nr:hypothetical protein KIL84_008204 [Mauremys mutica]